MKYSWDIFVNNRILYQWDGIVTILRISFHPFDIKYFPYFGGTHEYFIL